MYIGFDTGDEHAGFASLIIYATWRSRDKKRFKIDTEVWGRVERFAKSSAKRAVDLGHFLETFKAKMQCPTINPRYCDIGLKTITMLEGPNGELLQKADQGKRQFLTEILDAADDRKVLDLIYNKTAYIILLVRDRLEREKPIESEIEKGANEEYEIISN